MEISNDLPLLLHISTIFQVLGRALMGTWKIVEVSKNKYSSSLSSKYSINVQE